MCGEEQRSALLAGLRAHLAALRKQTYGKHICARLEKVLQATDKDKERTAGPGMLPGLPRHIPPQILCCIVAVAVHECESLDVGVVCSRQGRIVGTSDL